MKLSTLLILAAVLTGIAFHQTAKAEEIRYDFGNITGGTAAIQADVSAEIHDADDLRFLQRLSAVLGRAGEQMQQTESNVAGMFQKVSFGAEMQMEVEPRIQELQRRLGRLEAQVMSFQRIEATLGDLQSSLRGAYADEVASYLPELRARGSAKAVERERLYQELMLLSQEQVRESERAAHDLQERMDF